MVGERGITVGGILPDHLDSAAMAEDFVPGGAR